MISVDSLRSAVRDIQKHQSDGTDLDESFDFNRVVLLESKNTVALEHVSVCQQLMESLKLREKYVFTDKTALGLGANSTPLHTGLAGIATQAEKERLWEDVRFTMHQGVIRVYDPATFTSSSTKGEMRHHATELDVKTIVSGELMGFTEQRV